MQQNSTAGIIMSNQSLVLQRIDRTAAGIYTCLATNMEGHGESNALQLPVKCECLRVNLFYFECLSSGALSSANYRVADSSSFSRVVQLNRTSVPHLPEAADVQRRTGE